MPVAHWDIGLGQQMDTLNRLEYRYGRLVIQEPGIYFVYSQVHFVEYFQRDENSDSHHSQSSSYSHYVYKYNAILPNGGNQLLLHHSSSPCQSKSKDFHEYTSYVGAIFKLKPQDEIFVKVSNISMVEWDSRATYFGLYQIAHV